MNILPGLYDLLAGPFLYITVPLCIAGLARKAAIIISGRGEGLRFPVRLKDMLLSNTSGDMDYTTPRILITGNGLFLVSVSTLFHISILAAPLTARAHGILLDLAWNILHPRIDPEITGIFTATAVTAGILLILRRTFTGYVFTVSTWRDYAAMACVLAPFVTGLLARKQVFNYEAVMVIHCVSAHIFLLAAGWTRLGHMVFFIAGYFASPGIRKRLHA